MIEYPFYSNLKDKIFIIENELNNAPKDMTRIRNFLKERERENFNSNSNSNSSVSPCRISRINNM